MISNNNDLAVHKTPFKNIYAIGGMKNKNSKGCGFVETFSIKHYGVYT